MADNTRADALSGILLFEGVPPASLARQGLFPSSRALKAGEQLFSEGEARGHAWFVRSGWVLLRVHSPGGHEATANLLGPGEMCGLVGARRQIHPYSATALTGTVAVGVPAAAFDAWLESDARAALRVACAAEACALEIARLKAINGERAALRLTLTLGWLARKLGASIPATRALLADLTGLRAETCSRVLSGLRKRGIVKVSPRLIQVLQPDRLELAAARP